MLYAVRKGAAHGCERPKSREETPKKGSNSAKRYRTAIICHRAAQMTSETFSTSVKPNKNLIYIRKKAARNCKQPKSREETPNKGSNSAKALPHRNKMDVRHCKYKE